MSVALQAKLLQVLQDGEFSRLGGKHDVRVDVRVIAATNRNLERAVAEGEFREDLFFRLNVVAITLPPLRERQQDIPVLADYFLKKYSVQYNKPYTELSPDLTELFTQHDWPGNIRELENLIKRAVVLGANATIRKELMQALAMSAHRRAHLVGGIARASDVAPEPVAASAVVNGHTNGNGNGAAKPGRRPTPAELAIAAAEAGNYSLKDVSREAARQAERELIAKMLQQTRWNRKETAEILGISYKALLYKIKENGLDKAS
jgi:DNA-binding NtrC family response regulator